MDARRDEKTMNLDVDRLSSLPDDLIHKILSFIGLKRAIESSLWSSRWRYIWTSMPYLDFSSDDFHTLPKFCDFVTRVLSHRNNIVEVFSIKLLFSADVGLVFVKQVLDYAFSHNIQQLDVAFLTENNHYEFPLSFFSSQSLKHLSLTREFDFVSYGYNLTTTSTWELPALTSLYIDDVTFCCDDNNADKCLPLISKCANLKNLTLKSCKMKGLRILSICHPVLSNLTLKSHYGGCVSFKVVAPELKNLTITNFSWERYLISAPKLSSLNYCGSHLLFDSRYSLDHLEKVDLCIFRDDSVDARRSVNLFQQLQNVKFLRLNLELVELLSSFVELISHGPSPFANLKSLNIYPVRQLSEEEEEKKVKMCTEVKSYLLDNSPGATFTMVTREEIRDKKNTELAQKQMAQLQVRLEQAKANIEQRKTQADNQVQNGGRVKHVNRCWEDFGVQIEEGKNKTRVIISELKVIKGMLKKVPASKRDELQTCFSSLCAEADSVVNNILDNMKFRCDIEGSRFGVYFNDLASRS